MPTTYTAPGVYVEEEPSAIRPIAGVGTSTAGFVGQVRKASLTMPARPEDASKSFDVAAENVPVLVDSWEAFRTAFGDVQDGNAVLARAVYGFFDNGGGRCWVLRVDAALTAANAGTLEKALVEFAKIDEIALVAVPGATAAELQNAVMSHCETLKDRFAILDGVRTPSAEDEKTIRPASRTKDGYGAVYYPWIDVGVDDKGARILQPPSGHVAGVYARVDTERGVHKAPANEVIRGAVAVERPVSRSTQGDLNKDGVNVIRQVGTSVTIWGARTIATDSAWAYVTSRRMFNYLRESIDEGIQWAVFEPNAPVLWGMIRRNVGAFLTGVWATGALLGETPARAFYVRCDAETNPDRVRDAGQLVTEIGVALVKPAEFVIFRVSQWSGPAS